MKFFVFLLSAVVSSMASADNGSSKLWERVLNPDNSKLNQKMIAIEKKLSQIDERQQGKEELILLSKEESQSHIPVVRLAEVEASSKNWSVCAAHYEEAFKRFNSSETAERDPINIRNLLQWSNCSAQSGDLDGALKNARKAVSHVTAHSEMRSLRTLQAKILSAQGKYFQARELLQKDSYRMRDETEALLVGLYARTDLIDQISERGLRIDRHRRVSSRAGVALPEYDKYFQLAVAERHAASLSYRGSTPPNYVRVVAALSLYLREETRQSQRLLAQKYLKESNRNLGRGSELTTSTPIAAAVRAKIYSTVQSCSNDNPGAFLGFDARWDGKKWNVSNGRIPFVHTRRAAKPQTIECIKNKLPTLVIKSVRVSAEVFVPSKKEK